MAVAKMLKARLVTHVTVHDAVIRALQAKGLMEIRHVTEAGVEPFPTSGPGALTEGAGLLAGLVSELRFVVDFLMPYAPRKRSFVESFAPARMPVSRQRYDSAAADYWRYKPVYEKAAGLEGRLMELRNERARLEHETENLLAWQPLDMPLGDIASTGRVTLLAGSLDEEMWEPLQRELKEEGFPFYLRQVSLLGGRCYFLFACMSADRVMQDTLHRAEPQLVSFPSGTPPASRQLEDIADARDALEREHTAIEAEALRMAADLDLYASALDQLSIDLERLTAQRDMGMTDAAVIVDGWVKADDAARLEDDLRRTTPLLEIILERPQPEEETPVALVNPRLSRPFELVTRLYSLPSSRELDPTVSMSFFFFIFFGMALGDAGYGVLMALLSLAALRFLRTGRQLFKLLLICSVSTIIVGAWSGAWFGDLIFRGYDFIAGFSTIMLLSLGLGLLHLMYGLGTEFYENIRQGNIAAGIWDQLTMLAFMTGLTIYALAYAGILSPSAGRGAFYLAVGAAVAAIYGLGRSQKNPWHRLPAGLGGFYLAVTGLLSDVLSYLRLLALGLATGGIAVAVNQVAAIPREIPVVGLLLMVLILIFGHLANMFINILGAFIHSARLQFVEFFGKFYEGGGREFRPFKAETEYVEIIDG